MRGPTSEAEVDQLRETVEAIAEGFIRWYDVKSSLAARYRGPCGF